VVEVKGDAPPRSPWLTAPRDRIGLSDTFPCFIIDVFPCYINIILQSAHKSLMPGATHCFGAPMPRDRTGDLVNSGEVTPGELVEYAPQIVDQFPVTPYSFDEIIALHRQRNLARALPPYPCCSSSVVVHKVV
jgi:hypothetical protein